jgi:hypothetical protein
MQRKQPEAPLPIQFLSSAPRFFSIAHLLFPWNNANGWSEPFIAPSASGNPLSFFFSKKKNRLRQA